MSIDPRAHSECKLLAPKPLPYVSRKALKRVKNPLPAPTECPYCGPGSRVFLVNNSAIYNGRSYGDWPFAYLCRSCGAYVGLHPDTDLPLGTLADRELRLARSENKAHFNALMKKLGLSRNEAYQSLAEQMGISVEDCHWGWFDLDQCKRAGRICQENLRVSA